MQAATGDRLIVKGEEVGVPDRAGEIVEIHGEEGEPPFLVRWDDGEESIVAPGPNATVESHDG